MSLAADILRAAVERAHKVSDDHAARTEEVAGKYASHLGRPWKFKLDALREANEATAEDEPES